MKTIRERLRRQRYTGTGYGLFLLITFTLATILATWSLKP